MYALYSSLFTHIGTAGNVCYVPLARQALTPYQTVTSLVVMITVTISRKTLERKGACADGLALYDAIAAMQPATDPRRSKRIRVARWTQLHVIWLYVAGYGSFARWAEGHGLIPRASLAGAHLAGAYLAGADLTRANLAGANLAGAHLRGVNLAGAYLYGANLKGADLYGANLAGAYRSSSSPSITGWRPGVDGRLERE